MRRDISLDPDYTPYERTLVKLRKKRKRRPWLLVLIVVVALGAGVYAKESNRARANAVAVATFTPTPVVDTTEPTPTPCPPQVGEPGYLTLSYHGGCAATRLACDTYKIGTRIGSTDNAPVVPVEGDAVTLTCDGDQIEFSIP